MYYEGYNYPVIRLKLAEIALINKLCLVNNALSFVSVFRNKGAGHGKS